MASGTIIRLILGIIFISVPTITGLFCHPIFFYFYILDVVLIPVLIMWEDACNCDNCFLSSACNTTKRFNLIKNWLMFIGYDNDKLKQISFPSKRECENTYTSIYSYLMKKYELL